eukprot:764804-Hanusia_phi.AAC.5
MRQRAMQQRARTGHGGWDHTRRAAKAESSCSEERIHHGTSMAHDHLSWKSFVRSDLRSLEFNWKA